MVYERDVPFAGTTVGLYRHKNAKKKR